MSDYLFVYGKLRRGLTNPYAQQLEQQGHFLGQAYYRGKLYLVQDYPGVIPSDDPACQVIGDLYQLLHPDALLPVLDDFEGCGPGFSAPTEYIRCLQTVTLTTGAAQQAWIYLYNHPITDFTEIQPADYINLMQLLAP